MPDDRRPKFVVAYDPSFTGASGGVVTNLWWSGSMKDLLEEACLTRQRGERIAGLVVDEQCVTVYFAEKE